MFESPAAKPWCRLLASATSEIRVSAGAKQRPAPSEVMISAASTPLQRRHDGDHHHRHGADRQPDHVRQAAADAVGDAAGHRGKHRLQTGAGDEAGGDQPVAAAERVDPQRHQHLDRAEHHRGDGDEGGRLEHRPADQRRQRPRPGPALRARRLPAGARRRSRARTVITRTELKTISVPIEPAIAPSAGPSRAPATAVPKRGADHRAAIFLRRGRDQPGQRAGPDQRPGDPLDEAGAVEQEDLVGESEDEAGAAEQEQPHDHGALRPHPAGDEARRQRAQQRSRRIGGGEDPRLRLGQAEFVYVLRQQRRDRGEEGDVEEDHRRREEEQPAHPRIQSVRHSIAERSGRGGRAVECGGLESR